MADTGNVNVDTLEAVVRTLIERDGRHLPVETNKNPGPEHALAALSDLAARARDGQWCRDVFEGDPRSFLEGYKEMEGDIDRWRLVARARLEHATQVEADRDRLQVENESLRKAMLELAPALERVGKWLQSPVYPVDEVLADLQSVSAAAERAAMPKEES